MVLSSAWRRNGRRKLASEGVVRTSGKWSGDAIVTLIYLLPLNLRPTYETRPEFMRKYLSFYPFHQFLVDSSPPSPLSIPFNMIRCHLIRQARLSRTRKGGPLMPLVTSYNPTPSTQSFKEGAGYATVSSKKPKLVDLSRELYHRALAHPFHPPVIITPWVSIPPVVQVSGSQYRPNKPRIYTF